MMIDRHLYPHAAAFHDELASLRDRFIVPQIATLCEKYDGEYLSFLEKILQLSQRVDGKPVDSILDYTRTFLMEQLSYHKTSNYSHDSFDDVYDDVYNNPDVMEGYYLEGLMLTQACWAIHYHIHRFFLKEFLPRCAGKKQGLEIGFGHGLYLYQLLEKAGVSKVFGVDVSPYSLRFASRLLATSFPEERFELSIGDIQKGLAFGDATMEFGLLAEILEHIHHPRKALAEMARCLRKDSPLYVITPMNSNAIDHITNFESVDEIEEMIVSEGFAVQSREVLTIQDFVPESKDKTQTFCAVCTKQ